MSIEDQIQKDIIDSLKSGNQPRANALRFVKSVLKNKQIKKLAELTDEEVVKILQKEVEKRKEALEFAVSANRTEAIESNKKEIEIISKYLSPELTDEELKNIIKETIAKNPDLQKGPLTGKILGQLNGQVSGKRVVSLLEELL